MRWKKKYERIIPKFVIFPTYYEGEYIWLEMVYIKQRLHTYFLGEEEWWDDRLVSRKEYLEYKKNLRKKNNNEG